MKKMNTKINTAMLIPRQIDTKQPPFREYSMLLSSGECVNTKFARLLPLFLNSAGVPPYLNTIFRSASRSTEPILAWLILLICTLFKIITLSHTNYACKTRSSSLADKITGNFHPRTNQKTPEPNRALASTDFARDVLLHGETHDRDFIRLIALLSSEWILFVLLLKKRIATHKRKNSRARDVDSMQICHQVTLIQRREKNPDWSRELLFKFRINWFQHPRGKSEMLWATTLA